jgi:hypothetical protein
MRRARRGSGHSGEIPENASPGRTSGISSRHRPSLAFFHFLSRETGACHIASSLKNRPFVLDDRMAPLAQREQVFERRETAFASGNDMVNVQRGRAHGRAATPTGVPVTL